MDKNILLTIEYDGTDFYGWQRQKDKRTVQGEIESALSKIAGREISISGTSRTDRGVHALGQCASFIWDINIPTEKLPYILNNAFSGGKNNIKRQGDIRIVTAKDVNMNFHARFDARGKTYRYDILNRKQSDIFLRNYVYYIEKPINLELVCEAAKVLVGTHDFKSFEAAGGTPRETTIRTISDISIVPHDDIISFYITGDGFLYNMVRIIMGTLVEVGFGLKEAEDIIKILDAKNRIAAGHTAPPQGLYLEKVIY